LRAMLLWCRVMSDEPNKGEEGAETEDDVFLKKIESSMLAQVALQARSRQQWEGQQPGNSQHLHWPPSPATQSC
jgi:hypothetical protein